MNADPVSELVVKRPAGPLGQLVPEMHGYRERNVPPARHLGLPSPWLTVIFTLDEPLHLVQHVDRSPSDESFDALVGGLHTSPAVIAHDGAQSGIQLLMSPLGARALFGLPAGELAAIDAPAQAFLGRRADEITERLREATTWTERFAVLESHLAAGEPRVSRSLGQAWRMLVRSGGTARIRDIVDEIGWSDRHLAAQFRREIGLSPKQAARVIRFDRARRRLRRGTAGDSEIGGGARVAAECGYADQSHLVRDFTAFAGLSPTAWLAAEVGNIQSSSAVG